MKGVESMQLLDFSKALEIAPEYTGSEKKKTMILDNKKQNLVFIRKMENKELSVDVKILPIVKLNQLNLKNLKMLVQTQILLKEN